MRTDTKTFLRAAALGIWLGLWPLPATLDEPASATAGDPPGPAAGAPEESKSAAEADEEVAAEPFVPSEKISADSAVSFPVDI